MKHSKLHSVAHNLADSLSGGLSFIVPNYVLHTYVYAEAAATPEGYVVIDVLSGKMTGAFPGGDLEQTAPLVANAFPAFCAKHGVDHADYKECLVRFNARLAGNSFTVTITDRMGRRSAREYNGSQGGRLRTLDALSRLRPSQITPPGI